MNTPLWFSNLFFWYLQVALLVLVAAFLPRLFQIRRPGVLLAYWRALLLFSLVLPFVQPWHHPRILSATLVERSFSPAALPPPLAPQPSHWQLPDAALLAQFLAAGLLAGILIRLLLLAAGLLKLRQLRRASSVISGPAALLALFDQTRATVGVRADFRLSPAVDSPVTFGLAAPVILLPERFLALEPRFQAAIACHELLHVRRRDWAQHLAEEFLRGAFWFHPAIAWLISRVRLAREQVVDLAVVHLTQARQSYLEALLAFTHRRAAFAILPAPPFLGERQLVARIALMVQEVRMSRTRLIAALTASSLCIALAAIFAVWAFPLHGAPRLAQSPSAGGTTAQTPLLRRIQVQHHDFRAGLLNDAVINEEQARINALPGRLKVETTYDQAVADHMQEVLRTFWNERGVTVDVNSSLRPSPPSTRYAILQFDVFQQTLLPGHLTGGISGGVSSGVSGGISGGVASGTSGSVAGGVASGSSGAATSGARGGVSGGTSDGMSAGVSDGVSGGVSGERRTQASSSVPSVAYDAIWVDTVKRGPMLRQVRGLGKLVRAEDSTSVAQISMPVFLTVDVRPNQSAAVDTHMGVVKGHVVSISPSGDTCSIDVALDSALPERATVGLTVDATIDIEKLENVLYVGRPVHGGANLSIGLFKISKDGLEAQRVPVKLGRVSVNTIEVLDGLKAGDKIILSDMSAYDNVDRVRLTDETHTLKR